jgi:hypothetical protein
MKIGQRKRSYVSKKYNNNRNRNINGGSRYRRYGKTGGAGIVLGNSLLFPGTFSRMQSFQEAGKRGLKIFIGLIPVFIVAAFFESYVTRHYNNIPEIVKVVIIILSFTYLIWYFYLYPSSLRSDSSN